MTHAIRKVREFNCLHTETPEDAVNALQTLSGFYDVPSQLVKENIAALKTGNWEVLEGALLRGDFFSESRVGCLIADYRVWRPGIKTRISALLCEEDKNTISFPFDFKMLEKRYGKVTYTPVIPIHIIFSSGNIGGDEGELFIVPTAWKKMPGLAKTFPLLDIDKQIHRMRRRTLAHHWQSLADERLSGVILNLITDDVAYRKAIHWEYALHEYGHACGSFSENLEHISSKMAYAAFEEWRSDGIMAKTVQLHLEKGLITPIEARNIFISNFTTRFGLDITRPHARLDHDFLSAYYMMRGFLKTKLISLDSGVIRSTKGNPEHVDFWLSLYNEQALSGDIATRIEGTNSNMDTFFPSSDYSLGKFQEFTQKRISL